MMDPARHGSCPHCGRPISYKAVVVRCPYCDGNMAFRLPEYEFYEGVVGCEHCHRKSNIRIGGYYESSFSGSTLSTTEPRSERGKAVTGGRLLSIEAVVPADLALGISKQVPAELRQDLESAVKCFEIGEQRATAMLCRRIVHSALQIQGVREDSPSKMISIARNQNILSELARRQSDAVTFMGNKAAHPQDDPLLNLSESDTRQGLQMVRRILLELFDPDKLAVV